jgi:aspartate-semialdehyde dehydrogenase
VAALIGGASLLARELQDVSQDRASGWRFELIADEASEAGAIAEQEGEPVYLVPLNAASLGEARVLFLAGSAESSQKALSLAGAKPVIDLAGWLDEEPAARIATPGLSTRAGALAVVAHPAAQALAALLTTLAQVHPVERAVAHIFEPASERGQKAIAELQKQTSALLSFQKMPQEIFDAQLSFNLLPEYGEEAPAALGEAEARIERHLASLLTSAKGVPMPSLRLAQAPVFHGYSISLWVEMRELPSPAQLADAFGGARFDFRPAGTTPPTNVGAAQQAGIQVGSLRADRHHARGLWIWAAMDNLRLRAETALDLAKEFA